MSTFLCTTRRDTPAAAAGNVVDFMSVRLVHAVNERVPYYIIRGQYKIYCKDNGYKPLPCEEFKKTLRDAGVKLISLPHPKSPRERVVCVVHYLLKGGHPHVR